MTNLLEQLLLAGGAPFLGAYLAGRAGGIGEGFRPKGEKAVYPKSKKKILLVEKLVIHWQKV